MFAEDVRAAPIVRRTEAPLGPESNRENLEERLSRSPTGRTLVPPSNFLFANIPSSIFLFSTPEKPPFFSEDELLERDFHFFLELSMTNPAGVGKKPHQPKRAHNPSKEFKYYNNEIEEEHIQTCFSTFGAADATPEAAKQAYDACHGTPKLYTACFSIFGRFCRNCFLSGVGWTNTPQHTVAECKAQGNPCWVECRNCGDGRRILLGRSRRVGERGESRRMLWVSLEEE